MEKVLINNFRFISGAEFEIKPLTIFIGDNATGKSTVSLIILFFKEIKTTIWLHQLEIFRNATSPTDLARKIENEIAGEIENSFFTYFGAMNNLVDLVYENELLSFAVYQRTSDDELEFKIRFKEFSSRRYMTFLNREDGLAKRFSFSNQWGHYFGERSVYFPDNRNTFIKFSSTFEKWFLSNHRQNIELENSSHYDKNNELVKKFLLHKQALKDFFSDKASPFSANFSSDQDKILKGRFEIENNQEYLNLPDVKIPFSHASSGQQEILSILQDLEYLRSNYSDKYKLGGRFRVYEEAEAHLYPHTQKFLLESIINSLGLRSQFEEKRESKDKILLTSHTPYFLSTLNNCIYAFNVVKDNSNLKRRVHNVIDMKLWVNPDFVSVYHLSRDENNILKKENLKRKNGLIHAEKIDGVSETIENDLLRIMDFKNDLQ